MKVTIQFLGAAGTVTGSKYLLSVGRRRFLIDCGLFQGPDELKERNWQRLPIDATEIEKVILTHAHIDHIGYLPKLHKDGFMGPVLCTPGTAEITRLSLPDSGRLQEEYADYVNKKRLTKHRPALPLYDERDAEAAGRLLEAHGYDKEISLGGGCVIRFRRAGHILGSAFVEFFLPDGRLIVFGGDLGRPNQPIIRDPEVLTHADYLLVESTYGDRVHPADPPQQAILRMVRHVCETGGMLVIPSFAIGRTQDVLYYLRDLETHGECEPIPVWVDSPMAIDATSIYVRNQDDHDLDMEALVDEGRNPLRAANVTFVRGRDQSKALNKRPGPGIIISSSGMASGGRITHHLLSRLPDERNVILFVGYQAEGTLGRELVEGNSPVAILGEVVDVKARVEMIASLSAHADSNEIMDWLSGFQSPPKQTFVVHGEPHASEALQSRIERELAWNTTIPEYGELFELN